MKYIPRALFFAIGTVVIANARNIGINTDGTLLNANGTALQQMFTGSSSLNGIITYNNIQQQFTITFQ